MPRRRGGHQSVAVSPLDMLEEEVFSFQNQQSLLVGHINALGSPADNPELRKQIMKMKQGLAMAESSISNRLKDMDVPDEQLERLGFLEDSFFELKANYFSLLRQCVSAENIRMPEPEPQLPDRTSAPDVQRFGNPHNTPELQNMPYPQGPPAPLPRRPSSSPNDFQNGGFSPGFNQAPPSPQHYQQPPTFNQNEYQSQQPQYEQDHYQPRYEENQPQMLQQQQQQQQQMASIQIGDIQLEKRDSMFWDAKELVERNAEMQFISSEMVHLQDAFQDMATEVEVQGEREEEIEEHGEQAVENAKEGVQTLGKSAKNSKKVLLPGVGGGIGGVAGGFCGGVLGTFAGGLVIPGAVVGAAIGASAGATVGHGVGKVIRKGNDKDMAKARLNEKWAPDSSTKNCIGCERKFTQVKRRHHCRNCGGVFCGKCTKHKMTIPGVATESRPRVCNKCFEALMYNQQGIKPPAWRDQAASPTNSPVGSPQQKTLPPLPSRP